MSEVLKASATFFLYALVAVFTQNTIFARALGVSRLVKLVDDEAVNSTTFCLLLCAVQLISAPLAYGVNELWLKGFSLRTYVRPLVLILCSAVAFFVVLLLIVTVFKMKQAQEVAAVLPMATFNSAILGTLLVSTTQNFNFTQTMGFALGSGLGYAIAVYVVTEGQRKMNNDAVPENFRGLPVRLLYIGVLSLVIYAFTGHMISF